MNKKIRTKKDVRKKFVKKLDYMLAELEVNSKENTSEEMEKLRKISSLINELLEDDKLKDEFEKSIKSKADEAIKIKFFNIIRHILVHFPIYESWDDIYLNKEIVQWNRCKKGEIEKFFSGDNVSRKFSYTVYALRANSYEKSSTIDVEIPSIEDGFYLKELISKRDFKTTCYLIDNLLVYLDFKLTDLRPMSI